MSDENIKKTLPSPDLINYRFDLLDKQLHHFDSKLDKITDSFVSREDMATIKADIDNAKTDIKTLVKTDDTQQGYINANRRLINVGLILLGIAVTGITTYLGLHK